MRTPRKRRANAALHSPQGITATETTSPLTDFLRMALHYQDDGEASRIVAQQAGLEYDKQHGAELEQLALDQQDLDARYESSNDLLAQLQSKKKNTKEFVKRAEMKGEGGSQRTGFRLWRRRDQLTFLMLVAAQVGALGMGTANVFANLIASGQAVFAEKPWLALCLSAVVPAGACALKFVPGTFEHATTRRRYAFVVYGLTAAGLVLWTIFFALNYAGLSNGIDWDAMAENNTHGPWLVWSQLVLEVLIAGALFLAADELTSKYASDSLVENAEYLGVERALQTHLADHVVLRDERNAKRGRHAALAAARQAFINEHVAAYVALRSRVSYLKNL